MRHPEANPDYQSAFLKQSYCQSLLCSQGWLCSFPHLLSWVPQEEGIHTSFTALLWLS